MTTPEIERLYREGVAAIRAGNRLAAREKLMKVIEQDQLHEQAWLWLSAVVDTDEERIVCLENVLTINPDNEAARRGLTQLGVEAEPTTNLAQEPEVIQAPDLVAPQIIGTDMQAMLDGVSRKAIREEPPADTSNEAWRAMLHDPAAYSEHTASLVPAIEPPQSRSLPDLFSVWLDMLILNTRRGFVDEIKHGGFGHVVVNIVAAGLLQMIGTVMLFVMLTVLPGENSQPLLLSSTVELFTDLAEVEVQPQDLTSGTIDNVFKALKVFGITPFATLPEQVDEAGQEAALFSAYVAGMMGMLLLGYTVIAIPLTFANEMYLSLITNGVARWLRGKGDAIETMHALTTALVVAQIIQLPITFILPFIPLTVAITVLALVQIYQFTVTAVALGAVHKFGILVSIGVLLLSAGVGNAIAGGVAFVMSALFAAL